MATYIGSKDVKLKDNSGDLDATNQHLLVDTLGIVGGSGNAEVELTAEGILFFTLPSGFTFTVKIDSTEHLIIDETAITPAVPFTKLETTGRILGSQGASVASATNVTLGNDGNAFIITGTTTMDTIVTTGWTEGSIITLRFQGGLTVTNGAGGDGQFFNQTGLGNRTAAAGSQAVYCLMDIGGTLYWRELSYIA